MSDVTARRVIMLLGLLTAVALLAAAWQPLSSLIDRPLTEVRIAGITGSDDRVTAADLQQVAAPYIGDGFFSTDVQAVRDAVEAHPWVQAAAVRRVWPQTLVLQVAEHVPVARWRTVVQESAQESAQEGAQSAQKGAQDGYLVQDDYGMLVNRQAQAFGPVHHPGAATLPLLSGPDSEAYDEVITRYLALTRLMQEIGLRVASLHLSHRGSWSFVLEEKTLGIPTIHLQAGREEVIPRARRFVELYRSLPAQQAAALTAADLRYADGIALRGQPAQPRQSRLSRSSTP